MIIYLAGLQGIPKSYHEAAIIDGANGWKAFRFITLPLMIPAITTNVIFNLIGGLKLFALIVSLTGGGPGFASHSLSTLINYFYFENQSAGYSAALGMMTFIFIMGASLIAVKYFDKKGVEYY